MIAASTLEYMFITVTCCDETAKKLFGVCVRITMSTSLPGKLQDYLGLEILQTQFWDFPGAAGTLCSVERHHS